MVGEWIEKSYAVSYSRSALIKLLQRNDMEYRKPAQGYKESRLKDQRAATPEPSWSR